MEVLVVIDQPPYCDWRGREALDAGFALAAFDQSVTLLFAGPGVYWLLAGQQGNAIGQKTLTRQLSAAPMFGIDQILVNAEDCRRAGLTSGQLIEGVQLKENIGALYRQFHHVITL